jgi:hypothetical protein
MTVSPLSVRRLFSWHLPSDLSANLHSPVAVGSISGKRGPDDSLSRKNSNINGRNTYGIFSSHHTASRAKTASAAKGGTRFDKTMQHFDSTAQHPERRG